MKYFEIQHKADEIRKRSEKAFQEALNTHHKIITLEKELQKLRSERIRGVMTQRFNQREIFSKERRIRQLHREIDSQKNTERTLRKKAKDLSRTAATLYSLENKVHYGNEEALGQAKTLINRA